MGFKAGTKINIMLTGLALTGLLASSAAIVYRHQLDSVAEERRIGDAGAVTAVNELREAVQSLSRDIGRFAQEERANDFFVKDVNRQFAAIHGWSRALLYGSESPELKTHAGYTQWARQNPPQVVLPVDGRMAGYVREIIDATSKLERPWQELLSVKDSIYVYWGRRGESKNLEYLILRLGNLLNTRSSAEEGLSIDEMLSAEQRQFLTQTIPAWARQLQGTDSTGAELLNNLHAQMMTFLMMIDPVVAQGLSQEDALVATPKEVLGRVKIAYQNWHFYATSRLTQLYGQRRDILSDINEQKANLGALAGVLQRQEEHRQVLGALNVRRQVKASQYVFLAIGSLGLLLLVGFLVWTKIFSQRLTRQVEDVDRRCERTSSVAGELAASFKRHVVYIVEQSALLLKVSDSLKSISQQSDSGAQDAGREVELVRIGRSSLEEGLNQVRGFQGTCADLSVTSHELKDILTAINQAMQELGGFLEQANQDFVDDDLADDNPDLRAVRQALVMWDRVRSAISYTEKILTDHNEKAQQATQFSTRINSQFMQMGETLHQMMAMMTRMSASKITQREYLAKVIQEIGRVVQTVQANALEVQNSRLLSDEIQAHLGIMQGMVAQLGDLAGTDGEPAVSGRARRSTENRRRQGEVTREETAEEIERRVFRQKHVEQYFESFVKSSEPPAESRLQEKVLEGS